jgi:hypothetical protein
MKYRGISGLFRPYHSKKVTVYFLKSEEIMGFLVNERKDNANHSIKSKT